MSDGYEALQSGAGLLDLSSRGRIYVTGEDRARLLHALTTNHIQQLKPGESVYAFFLTAQGRILADAYVVCFEDKLLLDVEPRVREALYKHIDHYIIADDVTLEDATEGTFEFGVEGPLASAVVEGLRAVQVGSGFRIYGEKAAEADVRERLVKAGAVAATEAEARTVRIEHGVPGYGEDISSMTLPQETGVANALHFSKGCYLGQEIVERIRSRGHVNKQLTALRVEATEPVEAGTKVTAAGVDAGEITSSAYSPALGKTVAIAMMRVQTLTPGAVFDVGGVKAVCAVG